MEDDMLFCPEMAPTENGMQNGIELFEINESIVMVSGDPGSKPVFPKVAAQPLRAQSAHQDVSPLGLSCRGAALHMAQYLIKTPMYTSALTGAGEVLWIQGFKVFGHEEQLAMFLYMCRQVRYTEKCKGHDFAIPPGKYYLGDAGFLHVMHCCPHDYKELFNLHHAQAQNVVECIFGIVKWQFQLINTAPEYSLKKQAKMDLDGATLEDLNNYCQQSHTLTTDDYSTHISHEEHDQANDFQDRIAKEMWEQYQQYLQQNM
ncbi:transposase [Salix suchowensis]|nr:transposase [Salix suchowensis]